MPGIRTAYRMLGATGPDQWAAGRTAAERLAAVPGNHSAGFRPRVRLTRDTGVRAPAAAAYAHLAAPPASVKVASEQPSAGRARTSQPPWEPW
ncbi:hypothetical protein [Actinacidiphila sp. ITFR-21]|uniref:hypothetical protein n=1 Tax=Actinacidiphila sp. ITFR-21 TaxID=3075199 RepID=UPI00288B1F49|nr:hypothetical protein [Streptomyces sp. ITFR-21]WNI18556.1 hypothetical protein RLT57_25505 [Streptomyces sp. ITFR-21]